MIENNFDYENYKYETVYKCGACGYVSVQSFSSPFSDELPITKQGDEDFIYLGNVIKFSNGYEKETSLYACPKCGTVTAVI